MSKSRQPINKNMLLSENNFIYKPTSNLKFRIDQYLNNTPMLQSRQRKKYPSPPISSNSIATSGSFHRFDSPKCSSFKIVT